MCAFAAAAAAVVVIAIAIARSISNTHFYARNEFLLIRITANTILRLDKMFSLPDPLHFAILLCHLYSSIAKCWGVTMLRAVHTTFLFDTPLNSLILKRTCKCVVAVQCSFDALSLSHSLYEYYMWYGGVWVLAYSRILNVELTWKLYYNMLRLCTPKLTSNQIVVEPTTLGYLCAVANRDR